MLPEKVRKFMETHSIDWVAGPRVSYNYNRFTKNLVIITPRGYMVYNPSREMDAYFMDVLNYLVYGRMNERLKAVLGIDDPVFRGVGEVYSEKIKKFEYDVVRVRGKKRSGYLVYHKYADGYVGRFGKIRVSVDGNWMKVVEEDRKIYLGEKDADVLSAAIDGNVKKIYGVTTKFLDGRNIQKLSIVKEAKIRGWIVYNNRNKYYYTYFTVNGDGSVVVDEVPFFEGIYQVIIPADYSGPDPTSYYSVKRVPKGVEVLPIKDYPVKLRWGTKLAGHLDHPGVRFGRYKLFIFGENNVEIQKDGENLGKIDWEVFETLLSYGGDEKRGEFVLSML